MSIDLNNIDLEETAAKCLDSGIEALEKEVYHYKMAEEVYFMENGVVAKFTMEPKTDVIETNKSRLDQADIPYPETISQELNNDFEYGFAVAQRKMEQTFRNLIQDPISFVKQVSSDIIEPAHEEGFEVDTKPQNIYRDPETGKLGTLDIHDGKSTRADRTNPRNWMRYELKTGLNDLAETYEHLQEAVDAI